MYQRCTLAGRRSKIGHASNSPAASIGKLRPVLPARSPHFDRQAVIDQRPGQPDRIGRHNKSLDKPSPVQRFLADGEFPHSRRQVDGRIAFARQRIAHQLVTDEFPQQPLAREIRLRFRRCQIGDVRHQSQPIPQRRITQPRPARDRDAALGPARPQRQIHPRPVGQHDRILRLFPVKRRHARAGDPCQPRTPGRHDRRRIRSPRVGRHHRTASRRRHRQCQR